MQLGSIHHKTLSEIRKKRHHRHCGKLACALLSVANTEVCGLGSFPSRHPSAVRRVLANARGFTAECSRHSRCRIFDELGPRAPFVCEGDVASKLELALPSRQRFFRGPSGKNYYQGRTWPARLALPLCFRSLPVPDRHSDHSTPPIRADCNCQFA